MKERIVKYCSNCGYELRESIKISAFTYYAKEIECPLCEDPWCLHMMWVDMRNVDLGEKL
jgi:hypothetical protein